MLAASRDLSAPAVEEILLRHFPMSSEALFELMAQVNRQGRASLGRFAKAEAKAVMNNLQSEFAGLPKPLKIDLRLRYLPESDND